MGVTLQLTELNHERSKMTKEKVNLENQLEAEQEYILNKLHKQVNPSLILELRCDCTASQACVLRGANAHAGAAGACPEYAIRVRLSVCRWGT